MYIHKCFHNCSECKTRTALDRRRLESAHLHFAVLNIAKQYPDHFKGQLIHCDLQITLEEITPKLFQLFRQEYGGKKLPLHFI